jgi:hypothetical protein
MISVALMISFLAPDPGQYLQAWSDAGFASAPAWRLAVVSAFACLRVCLDVLALDSQGPLAIVKPAISNLCNVSVSTVFRCLRRAEYVWIAERIAGNGMNYSNGLISKRCEE